MTLATPLCLSSELFHCACAGVGRTSNASPIKIVRERRAGRKVSHKCDSHVAVQETWSYGNVVQADVQNLLAGACLVSYTSETAGLGDTGGQGQGDVGNTGLIQECAGT